MIGSSPERGAGCPFQLPPDSHWHTVLLGELEIGQGDPVALVQCLAAGGGEGWEVCAG